MRAFTWGKSRLGADVLSEAVLLSHVIPVQSCRTQNDVLCTLHVVRVLASESASKFQLCPFQLWDSPTSVS